MRAVAQVPKARGSVWGPRERALRARLIRWFDAHRRDLPWRPSRENAGRGPTPYEVWVSEVMLQQTRADVVVPYYTRFLARFPSVRALAEADLTDVLAAWSGLGYYARARNLHAAAREMVARHGGEVPADPEALAALPGFGRYTRGAVLSIAFGREEPVVDGNVARVLSRLWGRALSSAEQWELAARLVRGERPGDLNQAVMELGATVCTPRVPRCAACPLAPTCAARAAGTPQAWPPPRARPARPRVTWACALVARRGRVLFVRRPERGLFGGLWELPSVELAERMAPEAALAGALREGLGLSARVGPEVARATQVLTHRELTLVAHRVTARGRPRPSNATWTLARWIAPADALALGLSSLTRKLLAALAAHSPAAIGCRPSARSA